MLDEVGTEADNDAKGEWGELTQAIAFLAFGLFRRSPFHSGSPKEGTRHTPDILCTAVEDVGSPQVSGRVLIAVCFVWAVHCSLLLSPSLAPYLLSQNMCETSISHLNSNLVLPVAASKPQVLTTLLCYRFCTHTYNIYVLAFFCVSNTLAACFVPFDFL